VIVLGIESTAHTIGIGVYDGKRLTHKRHVYRAKGEGMIPRKLGDHHQQWFSRILKDTLDERELKPTDIDMIAFSQGPGIGQPLQFGCAMARYLSLKVGAKLIPVNHCAAHIEIGIYDTRIDDPLVIYASGGNTQLIVKDKERYRVLGETLDIGIGNLFDVLARELGLEYGHGAELERLARNGRYIESTPYSVKGMNTVFGGLLTYAKRIKTKYPPEDIAYSVMHNAFAMLVETAERAFWLTGKKGVIVCGGVAQNSMLQTMLDRMLSKHQTMCGKQKARLGIPRNEYNGDNGAMIAYTGYELYQKFGDKATINPKSAVPRPRWRIDQVNLVP